MIISGHSSRGSRRSKWIHKKEFLYAFAVILLMFVEYVILRNVGIGEVKNENTEELKRQLRFKDYKIERLEAKITNLQKENQSLRERLDFSNKQKKDTFDSDDEAVMYGDMTKLERQNALLEGSEMFQSENMKAKDKSNFDDPFADEEEKLNEKFLKETILHNTEPASELESADQF